MGVLDGKAGTLCPPLAIPFPPLKLVSNIIYLNLVMPLHTTPFIAIYLNTQ